MPGELELEDLQTALDQPELRESFKRHLAKEFSSENMAFYEAVNDFKAAAQNPQVTDQQLRVKARQLYNTFVDDSGHVVPGEDVQHNQQVNLSAKNTADVKADIANLATKNRAEMGTLFDEGRKEVVAMMGKDSFNRFKSGEDCKATLKKLEQTVTDSQEKIKQLEARVKTLETSKTEQFKAYFNGGVDKVKQDLKDQIELEKRKIRDIEQPFNPAPVQPQVGVGPQVQPPPQPQVQVPQVPGPQPIAQAPVLGGGDDDFSHVGRGRAQGVDNGRKSEGPGIGVGGGEQIEEVDLGDDMVEEVDLSEKVDQSEEVNVDDLADLNVSRDRSNALNGDTSVTDMSMDDFADVSRDRSKAVDEGQKKPLTVRESLGKKPEETGVGVTTSMRVR